MSDQQQQLANNDQSGSKTVNPQQLKSQITNKLQSNKLLVLKLYSVLSWEQDIYPIVVVAAVSVAFFLISLFNSSILATLSYLGIILALADLALPTLTKNLASKQAKLSDKDNQRFDKICADLAKVLLFLRSISEACCSLKSKKPSLYYPALLTSLLVSAYLGNKINNLFLTYLITLFVALLPGLEKRGYTDKAVDFINVKLGRQVASSSGAGDRRASGKKN